MLQYLISEFLIPWRSSEEIYYVLNMSKVYSNNLKIIIIIPYLKHIFFSLKSWSFGTKNLRFLRTYEKVVLPASQVLIGQQATLKAMFIHCRKKEEGYNCLYLPVCCVKIFEMVGKQLISRNNHGITNHRMS